MVGDKVGSFPGFQGRCSKPCTGTLIQNGQQRLNLEPQARKEEVVISRYGIPKKAKPVSEHRAPSPLESSMV